MDGVLIDSEPVHKLAKERAFARFGVRLPETVYERYKGRPDEAMMKEVVGSIPGTNLDPDELLHIKHSEFEAIEQLAVPIEGAKNLVNWAKSRFQVNFLCSVQMAVLSKKGLTIIRTDAVIVRIASIFSAETICGSFFSTHTINPKNKAFPRLRGLLKE